MTTLNFNNLAIEVLPHPAHQFVMDTDTVARGFGINPATIRSHKSRHAAELVKSKHWLTLDVPGPRGTRPGTFWTKRGVVRLGFLVDSPTAAAFRDWCEDLVLEGGELPVAQSNTKGVTDRHTPAQSSDTLALCEALLGELKAQRAAQVVIEQRQARIESRLRAVEDRPQSPPALPPPAGAALLPPTPAGESPLRRFGEPYYVMHSRVQAAAKAISEVTGDAFPEVAKTLWRLIKPEGYRGHHKEIPEHFHRDMLAALEREIRTVHRDFPDLQLGLFGLGGLN